LYVNPANPTYNPATPQDNVPAARFAQLASRVDEAMVAESARWGDQHTSIPRTRNVDWQNELNYMLGTYFRDRPNIVLTQWRSANLYPTTIAAEFLVNGVRQHGGSTAEGATLSFLNLNTSPPGAIYFTTDGSDPRLIGGAVNGASAQLYSAPVSLAAATHIKARVLRNGQWSALTDATFSPPVISPDFDADGDVDGADFLTWQRGLGISGNAAAADGDADGDKDVDGMDLGYWKTQFAGPASAAIAVEATSRSEESNSTVDSDLDAQTPTGAVPSNAWFTLTAADSQSVRLGVVSPAARLRQEGLELRTARRNPTFEPPFQPTAYFGTPSQHLRRHADATDRSGVDDVFAQWDLSMRPSIAGWL
jgi:hypothetical protein